jgi:methionine-S-sulfoxide reductase
MENQCELATFAGGCFWCLQGPFDHLDGVMVTKVGYTGGRTQKPTYDDVTSGKTGHLEAIQITFNPSIIPYTTLLEVFWRNIDPTDPGGQFADRGTQYQTAIFYHSSDQQNLAEASKVDLEKSGVYDKSIATKIMPVKEFYPAEEYHQFYYKKNPLRYELYYRGSGHAAYLHSRQDKL